MLLLTFNYLGYFEQFIYVILKEENYLINHILLLMYSLIIKNLILTTIV